MSRVETGAGGPAWTRMRLRYGVNETDSWWYFALGPQRERIWTRLRELGTQLIRIFLFDKGTPDPVSDWPAFEAYVQAVLNVGATPLVTFAKFDRPYDDPRAVRWFANRCADVVWACLERWGPQAVRGWYWCVWNEPNSTWIGGGLTFERYRRIYEEVARGVLRWLGPYLNGRRLPLGGPSVEGFQPFWLDWIWRFLNEIDSDLIGFVNWHRYADWRDHGEKGAPQDPATHRDLMLAQTPDYEARARDVARLLPRPGILNICGEWNAHSHYEPHVRARFNQSLFGAAYGVSALLHLIRAGVDAEMLWTGTDVDCGYGVLDQDARPTPLFHAKKLCASHVRAGDWVAFPLDMPEVGQTILSSGALADRNVCPTQGVDAVVARGDDGQLSALVVHLQERPATYSLSALADGLSDCRRLLKIDGGTGGGVAESTCAGTITFEGYGVAVVTNAAPEAEGDRAGGA